VGKTYKDVRDFDVKRHKEVGRKVFKDVDMRTRVKPVDKKSKRGPKNLVRDLDSYIEEEYDDHFQEDFFDNKYEGDEA